MRRRDFVAFLTAAAGVRPHAASAQQPARIAKVGGLLGQAPEKDPAMHAAIDAFTQALARLGWVEGKNIHIDFRFAGGDPVLYERYAAELVALAPDALIASPSPAVMALRGLTSTIPIVFVLVPDPVNLGVVQSLAHPGGNITGFTSYDAAMIGKWMQLLKESAPDVTRVALMYNPDTTFAPSLAREYENNAARSIGVAEMPAPVHNAEEIEAAIANVASQSGGGLICLPDSFNAAHRDVIVAAAMYHRVPMAGLPNFVRAGGLISYWFNDLELYSQAAGYIDRILKGTRPADLPVQQPTKYKLVINLKTAKALGLTVPPSLLARADEVIE